METIEFQYMNRLKLLNVYDYGIVGEKQYIVC